MMFIYVLLIVLAVILFGIGIIISNIRNKVIKSELSKSSYNLDNEESNNNHINVQNYLINMYDRILFTESRVVESKIKEFKKPINASMLIIESGCENCVGGEYPPDEDIQLPPFHPNCNCTHYYETTDDEDDINDLDLEIEE